MNKKVNIDKEVLKLLYLRYKNYLVPVSIILFCVILFAYVVIPQIENLRNLQRQEKEEVRKLEILRNNLNLLSSVDSQVLNNQLKLVSKALPTEKDFIGILNGVTIASQKTNVTLDDYGFQVGDVNKSPASVKGIPSIELLLTINGDLNSLIQFINELRNTVPISEVRSIEVANKKSTVTTMFYYKPLPPLNIKDDLKVEPFSSSALELLKSLEKMNNAKSEDLIQVAPAENSSPGAVFFGI